jgi:dihydrofolate reductase
MSMSVDGYIAGPGDDVGNPGGDGFMRLHEWYGYGADGTLNTKPGAAEEFVAETLATGAVVAGRRTVEQVDHWGGDEHGVPIFVPSHRPPGPTVANYPLVTYVSDTRRSARLRRVCSTSCRSIRSRCCSAPAAACSMCCLRVSSSRSSG